MKTLRHYLDVFVIGCFVTSFFYGLVNPLYVSVILSQLDGRIIALGSFMSSAFPVAIGAILGSKRIFEKLYGVLPVVMIAELVVTAASVVLAAFDLAAYYLLSMFIMGVFSASVIYLLQKVKERKYRRNRAEFDRRCAMADAFGAVGGSALSLVTIMTLRDPLAIAALAVGQTAVTYVLFLFLYRKVPQKRQGTLAEEGHPWPQTAPFAEAA